MKLSPSSSPFSGYLLVLPIKCNICLVLSIFWKSLIIRNSIRVLSTFDEAFTSIGEEGKLRVKVWKQRKVATDY